MSDSLLNALKLFVIVGAVLLVGGTAILIWVLVKRGANDEATAVAPEAAPPGTALLPAGAEITQASLAGARLLLLGRAPGDGQFVLIVDAASGERRSYLRLVPAGP